jgi:hypothetical protein
VIETRRRRLEIALGGLWLLDGGLQFQPYMFGHEFFAGILGMANMGLPGPLSKADYHLADLLAAHPVVWNTIFASLQVGIGAGLIWGKGRLKTAARFLSLFWALSVWIVGEGVGGLFMGGTSILTGGPGAALLYGVLTVATWSSASPSKARPAAHSFLRQQRLLCTAWVLIWLGGALLELEPVNRAAGVPGAQIANGAYSEPRWVGAFDRAIGHVLSGDGAAVAALLSGLALFAGLGVLSVRTRRLALVAGVAVAAFAGLAGQDVGGILSGTGTDPGTGPLLVLLAICLWPAAPSDRPARRPQLTLARPAPLLLASRQPPGGREEEMSLADSFGREPAAASAER